ncbi:MAG: TlpA family protein disulfide reductase [Desulfobulbaceae bacterium]|nr:TlpA family protein disulfide reductase [Candidatus Kapabacteria bacterium]MBS4001495.1 TlpA family protein disulfide reductase [Desulfobulbaceae bacterium]
MSVTKFKKTFALPFAFVALAALFIMSYTNSSKAEATSKAGDPIVLTINSVIPNNVAGTPVNFKFTHNGKETTFAEFTKGKVVFLNFWGTWCPPCRKEIPDIIEIQKELANKDFVVIGVAMERDRDPMTKVTSFSKAQGINYINFIGVKELFNAYGGISSVPTTYIIGADGKIEEVIVGMRAKSQFMKSISKVLKS